MTVLSYSPEAFALARGPESIISGSPVYLGLKDKRRSIGQRPLPAIMLESLDVLSEGRPNRTLEFTLMKHRDPHVIRASDGIVIAIILAAVFLPHFHRQKGLTSLIRFGERRQQSLAPELAGTRVYFVPHHAGFDGQFYAHMALHPPWIYHDLIFGLVF